MSKPQVEILVGPPTTGKTTYAQKRAQEKGWCQAHSLTEVASSIHLGWNVVIDSESLQLADIKVLEFPLDGQ